MIIIFFRNRMKSLLVFWAYLDPLILQVSGEKPQFFGKNNFLWWNRVQKQLSSLNYYCF